MELQTRAALELRGRVVLDLPELLTRAALELQERVVLDLPELQGPEVPALALAPAALEIREVEIPKELSSAIFREW